MIHKKELLRGAAGVLMSVFLCSLSGFSAFADTAQAAGTEAFIPQVSSTITSCTIGTGKGNIHISAQSSGDVTGTDGWVYLFELKPYQDSIGERSDYLGYAVAGQPGYFTVPLNFKTPDDRLYSKFVMAVFDGKKYIEVSEPHYITNPEILANNTNEFKHALTKKGLNIEINMLDDAFELGVKHVGVNIAFHQILGSGIDYVYDGQTYHFSKEVIESYDKTISALSGKDMTVTAIILNGWNEATPDLIYPGTQKSSNAFYYAFNVATEAGFKQTRAIASFLAERYGGTNPEYGKISNWIIGNEINNQQWNYVGATDLKNYVDIYADAFRVFYSAIKSVNANDRVYFSLDYNWNNEIDGKVKYGGKEIVDTFSTLVKTEGDMDWGLAYHPYPAPMTEPEFWDDDQTGLITNDFNSPVINFKNLNTLTDYFEQQQLRSPSGEVRNIILTEEGFTATSPTRGKIPQIQAAAFAYSYYLVDSNPHIDAYILSRQVDAPSEAKIGLSFGLWECDMSQPVHIIATNRRKIWQVFKNIDKKDVTLDNTEFAKSIIGIEKWSDVIPNFKWKYLEDSKK